MVDPVLPVLPEKPWSVPGFPCPRFPLGFLPRFPPGFLPVSSFQARLRQGRARYPEALEALRQAESLDPVRYATHEGWKYPVEAIPGAGGMGCALLCREPVRRNRTVVVKSFWQTPPGATEKIFAEAIAMDEVGRDHAPALLG